MRSGRGGGGMRRRGTHGGIRGCRYSCRCLGGRGRKVHELAREALVEDQHSLIRRERSAGNGRIEEHMAGAVGLDEALELKVGRQLIG